MKRFYSKGKEEGLTREEIDMMKGMASTAVVKIAVASATKATEEEQKREEEEKKKAEEEELRRQKLIEKGIDPDEQARKEEAAKKAKEEAKKAKLIAKAQKEPMSLGKKLTIAGISAGSVILVGVAALFMMGVIGKKDPVTDPDEDLKAIASGAGSGVVKPPEPEPKKILDPRGVVEAFLAAQPVEERLAFCKLERNLEQKMSDYYRGRVGGTGVQLVSITDGGMTLAKDGKSKIYLFDVKTQKNPGGYLLPVEETHKGLRVQWSYFVQCEDKQFEAFVARASLEETGQFYLLARMAETKEPELSKEKGFVCAELLAPYPGFSVQAYAQVGSTEARVIEQRYSGASVGSPVLELTWRQMAGGKPYLLIRRILNEKWKH